MRTDILDLHGFYKTPLGRKARGFVAARLAEAWRDHARCRILGYGYTEPYLPLFPDAERRLAFAPAAQGALPWPVREKNAVALIADYHWPLADASVDRILMVHGLEETGDPTRLLREAWRVLAPDGRLIVVTPHRRGLWSSVDTTPFAHGRPFLRRQLERLLGDTLFCAEAWAGALHFPPLEARFLLRAADAWERAGARLTPGLSGVLMVEATKDMARPVARAVRAPQRLRAPVTARPAIAPSIRAVDNRALSGVGNRR